MAAGPAPTLLSGATSPEGAHTRIRTEGRRTLAMPTGIVIIAVARTDNERTIPVRATTLLRNMLAVTSLFVLGVRWEDSYLVVPARPRWKRPRCGQCGEICPRYDQQRKPRRWRALGFGEIRIYLEYTLRRVTCPTCGVRTEGVPWSRHGARFTHDFEEMVAYLAQRNDQTTVTRLMGVSWRTVGRIVDRVVTERLDPSRLVSLRRIGIDDFSYRKRHRYLTVVVDHDTRRVVWAAKGRGSETLKEFFDLLGPLGRKLLRTATIDMAGGYIKALKENVPHVKVVFDRFHVAKLASDAVDKVRCAQWRELKGTDEGVAIKGSKHALLKNRWNLTREDRQKLSDVQSNNRTLYRAYLLKETLAKALDYRQPKRATDALNDWLAWASRSRLTPFVKAARTIRKHKDGILAYIRDRETNGLAEGLNNRIRVVARRAFGFHSAKSLIAMIHLCCSQVYINPRLP